MSRTASSIRLGLASLALLLAFGPVLSRAQTLSETPYRPAPPGPSAVDKVFDALAARHGGARPAFVRLLTDNQDSWYARWHIFENAKKSIDCVYFILENDIFGRAFLGQLFKKAKEGVQVRLMLDARGTKALTRRFFGQDILQELVQLPNVQVSTYNPVYKAFFALPEDLRSGIASNHDKLVIVDGEWVITGGRNISSHYFAHVEDEKEAYRDTDVLIRGGDVPAQAKRAFDEEFVKPINHAVKKDLLGNWVSRAMDLELARRVMHRHMSGDGIADPGEVALGKRLAPLNLEVSKYVRLTGYAGFTPFRGERAYPVLMLDKHSLREDRRNDITASLEKLIDAASFEVLIQNPYVILTKTARACLKRASDRGVKVIINTNSPESTDSLLTQAMFVREWKNVLHEIQGLRIYAIKGDNKLHAKVFVIDRKISVIGTYNMDPLSEEVNSEDVAVVKSGAFAGQNFHRIAADVAGSVEYKIRVGADGAIEQVCGPSDHCSREALAWVERLGMMAFLRPLI
jgi:phosphatidylserine/phosphatidylglycerophosphate/cardiolipin synthase-like enzyme